MELSLIYQIQKHQYLLLRGGGGEEREQSTEEWPSLADLWVYLAHLCPTIPGDDESGRNNTDLTVLVIYLARVIPDAVLNSNDMFKHWYEGLLKQVMMLTGKLLQRVTMVRAPDKQKNLLLLISLRYFLHQHPYPNEASYLNHTQKSN